MEVDTSLFLKNINLIQKYVGNKKIMPVIKANAYGTYINKRIDVINRFDIVAVAFVSEAVELRKLGYEKDIFILNQPAITEIDDIIEYDIIIGLSSDEFLEKIINDNNQVRVHLEIETGMNRTGIQSNKLNDFIKKIKCSNIKVEGVYTHLSSADYDNDYTNYQLKKFKDAVDIVKEYFDVPYIHSCASNGLLNYHDNISNLVRVGIIMYGYESFNGVKEVINIKPICKLKTKITFIKEIEIGESISYSRKYITDKRMRVGTIPIGYADGFRRISNDLEVIVNGKKVKVLGTICMDSCMIDVSDIDNVEVGNDVYIWDNVNISLEELAKEYNTINYEVMCTISNRVPRIFI